MKSIRKISIEEWLEKYRKNHSTVAIFDSTEKANAFRKRLEPNNEK